MVLRNIGHNGWNRGIKEKKWESTLLTLDTNSVCRAVTKASGLTVWQNKGDPPPLNQMCYTQTWELICGLLIRCTYPYQRTREKVQASATKILRHKVSVLTAKPLLPREKVQASGTKTLRHLVSVLAANPRTTYPWPHTLEKVQESGTKIHLHQISLLTTESLLAREKVLVSGTKNLQHQVSVPTAVHLLARKNLQASARKVCVTRFLWLIKSAVRTLTHVLARKYWRVARKFSVTKFLALAAVGVTGWLLCWWDGESQARQTTLVEKC